MKLHIGQKMVPKWPKNVFLILKNLVITFCWSLSWMKVHITKCLPNYISYLGKFCFWSYRPKSNLPVRLHDSYKMLYPKALCIVIQFHVSCIMIVYCGSWSSGKTFASGDGGTRFEFSQQSCVEVALYSNSLAITLNVRRRVKPKPPRKKIVYLQNWVQPHAARYSDLQES